jgi:hypothetical protein
LKARFIRQFGPHGVGSEIELPDGSNFDNSYLEEVVPDPEPEVKEEPKPAAEAPKEGDK